MRRVATFVLAVGVGLAWSAVVAPVGAGEVKDKARETGEEASEAAGRAKDTMKSAGQKVKEKAIDVKDDVKARLRRNEEGSAGGGTADVRKAQEALRAQGFDPGPVDGVPGPRTDAAVRDFQKKNGLPVTGRLDDATASRLGDAQGESASPATGPRKP
jgi:peptidoglycan hydrolase-like protein with peptidoglycan-binding domain